MDSLEKGPLAFFEETDGSFGKGGIGKFHQGVAADDLDIAGGLK